MMKSNKWMFESGSETDMLHSAEGMWWQTESTEISAVDLQSAVFLSTREGLTYRQPRDWGSVWPEPKPSIKRLSDCGVEDVEMDQWVKGDSVEGHRANSQHCFFPSDYSITHWYMNPSSPLNLPAAATSQTSSTQQLRPVDIKFVWMIRIWLILCHPCHCPVVVRQFEFSVLCLMEKTRHNRTAVYHLLIYQQHY